MKKKVVVPLVCNFVSKRLKEMEKKKVVGRMAKWRRGRLWGEWLQLEVGEKR